jgi:TrmH family RNA methyltransferase
VRITSRHNPVVKYVRSLERASVRREEGVFLVEGVRLVQEAWQTGQFATIALYDPDLLRRSAAGTSLLGQLPRWAESAHEVDAHVLTAAAQTEHPSGVLAVLRMREEPPLATHDADHFGVILDAVSDPGNTGTIVRTAAAAGVNYLLALGGSADLYSPKVVRAGMGAHFRLPLYQHISWDDIASSLPDVTLVATDARADQSIYGFEWPQRSALVIGAEAYGLSRAALAQSPARVRIPMTRGVESLNAAVAASIVIYSALGPEISSEE